MTALLFLRNYGKYIGIALALFVAWLWLNGIISERDEAKENLRITTEAIRDNAIKAEAKNEALKAEGKRNVQEIEAKHVQDINLIASQYVKEWKNDSKNNRAIIADLRNQLSNGLREQATIYGSSIAENDTDRLARDNGNPAAIRSEEESIDFYKKSYSGARLYIETLENAGAMCAADYNKCYAYVKSEQARLGVESE